MYLKFWGTRGSIPTSLSSKNLKRKLRRVLEGAAGLDLNDNQVVDQYLQRLPYMIQGTAGGDTTCLELHSGDQMLIIDAGSGMRLMGIDFMKRGFQQGGQQADILFTHTHWDHIQGFPFFQPAFVPNNHFTIYSPFPDLKERLIKQQDETFFPVSIDYMRAEFEFVQIKTDDWTQVGNLRFHPIRLSHPGITYGYRIEDGHSTMVLATDSEYKCVSPEGTQQYVEFFREADLLIFDAQYSFTEVLDRVDWGHSTAMMGAELAHRADVKRLALFHHDPNSNDEEIWQAKDQAEAYLRRRSTNNKPCEVFVAYDGLSLEF